MRSPLPDYLSEVLASCSPDLSGELADYIPELAEANPDRLALAMSTIDGEIYSVGDDEVPFTIQSISKPFVYALAIQDSGFDTVMRHISVEPSGNAFNELSLEAETGRPYNPMINAGAIASHSLVIGPHSNADHRTERIREFLSQLAGRELHVNEQVFESELETAHRNLGIAHMLRAIGILEDDPDDVVRGYTRQCAIDVTVRDLAMMGATLAGGGRLPRSGESVVQANVVRQVLSVMMSCGMYDAAGDWITTVGIPAKSGVSGGVVGALPGQVGLAAFSPRLDHKGNSVRGVDLFQRLSSDMGLHLMSAEQPARSVVREIRAALGPDDEEWVVAEIYGAVRFTGAERITRGITTLASPSDGGPERIVMDFSDVFTVGNVARRILVETARRLALDGRRVVVLDPDDVLRGPGPKELGEAELVRAFTWRDAEARGTGGTTDTGGTSDAGNTGDTNPNGETTPAGAPSRA